MHFPRLVVRKLRVEENFDAELLPALEFCNKEEKSRRQRALKAHSKHCFKMGDAVC